MHLEDGDCIESIRLVVLSVPFQHSVWVGVDDVESVGDTCVQ